MTDGAQLAVRGAEAVLREWACDAAGLVPAGCCRIDAHTHAGLDSDGQQLQPRELVAQLDAAAIDRAVVAPLHHPEGYTDANAELAGWAAASGGRLMWLCRVDPHDGAKARRDVERALAGGDAIGVKLHPRAEQFSMADPGVRGIAEAAASARALILIHAGRGMPALGHHVLELARELPDATFVLAHAAVSDLSWIAPASRDVPNLVFDTSWWTPIDLAALLATVPPSRVLFGSDPPYGAVPLGVVLTARPARALGYDDDAMRLLFGGNAARVIARGPGASALGDLARALPDAAAADARWQPVDDLPATPWPFRRCAAYLQAALSATFSGGDPAELLELASHALDVAPDDEDAAAAAELHAAVTLGRALLAGGNLEAWGPQWRAAVQLLVATLVHAATPGVPIAPIRQVVGSLE